MPRITFHPKKITRRVHDGITIMNAINRNELPLGQSCSGFGICGWCRITVLKGSENISQPTPRELKLITEQKYKPNERLGCQAHIHGDVEITTGYW